jgi:hypothetical protein
MVHPQPVLNYVIEAFNILAVDDNDATGLNSELEQSGPLRRRREPLRFQTKSVESSLRHSFPQSVRPQAAKYSLSLLRKLIKRRM